MNFEEELIRISNKIDKYHEEDKKRAHNAEYKNLSYILWAFAIGTSSLFVATGNLITIFIAVVFLIGGFVALCYGRRFKVD